MYSLVETPRRLRSRTSAPLIEELTVRETAEQGHLNGARRRGVSVASGHRLCVPMCMYQAPPERGVVAGPERARHTPRRSSARQRCSRCPGQIRSGSSTLRSTGGAVYTIGTVLFALEWPDPWPDLFGRRRMWHITLKWVEWRAVVETTMSCSGWSSASWSLCRRLHRVETCLAHDVLQVGSPCSPCFPRDHPRVRSRSPRWSSSRRQ